MDVRTWQEIAELARKQYTPEGKGKGKPKSKSKSKSMRRGSMTYRQFYNYISSVTFNSAMRPEAENTVYQVGRSVLLVWFASW